MKLVFTFLTLMLLSNYSFGQTPNPNYDKELAERLGADEYGMKQYMFVILKTGSNDTENKQFVDSCFAGHIANIQKLVEENKLVVAGPMGKNEKEYRGIFILNVSTEEEALVLLQSDPAIKENLLEAELYNWYGSAALPEYLESSEKVGKTKF